MTKVTDHDPVDCHTEIDRLRAENKRWFQRVAEVEEVNRHQSAMIVELRAELEANRTAMDLQHENRLRVEAENERLQEDNRVVMAAEKATQAENDKLRVECQKAREALAAETGWRVPYIQQMKQLRAENERLQEVADARQQVLVQRDEEIERLRAGTDLHEPTDENGTIYCSEDGKLWPCPTVRAIQVSQT